MNPLTIPVMKTFNKSTNKYKTVDAVCYEKEGDNSFRCQYKDCTKRINGKTKQACYMHTRLYHPGCKSKFMSKEKFLDSVNKKRKDRSTYNAARRSIYKKPAAGSSSKGKCHVLNLCNELNNVIYLFVL